MATTAPYGTWASPISAADVAAGGGGPSWTELHEGAAWWTEGRPAEDGRVALVRSGPGGAEELLPAPWSARNRVVEYGGHPYAPLPGGGFAFTEWSDQRVYAVRPGYGPVPLTPAPDRPHGLRYADLVPVGAELWGVRETVTGEAPTDIERDLVGIALDGSQTVRSLAASHHFLTGPRVSPDGRHAAWIGWDHPNMPWDGSELCVAPIGPDGSLGPHRVLAGGPAESVCQVEWDGPDRLLALTDPTGWWNLHRIPLDGGPSVNLTPWPVEFGGAMWKIGLRWFAALGGGRHVLLRAGALVGLDEAAGTLTELAPDLPVWSSTLAAAPDGTVFGAAAGPTQEYAAALLSGGALTMLSAAHRPDPAYLPVPVERTFTAADGAAIPAYVFAPASPDHAAPPGELPPYIVHVHGGPTGRIFPTLDLEVAYFTSRGFGVVLPNYGGSTGYGRAYRERLREQWGVVDVTDCMAVAEALVAEGRADPERLLIRGGSAGGWTTAVSLTRVSTYRAGTSMYPILDLLGWATGETHDFESHYLESIVGPLDRTRDRYLERSASSHAARLAGPILLLQGLDDHICPPVQAERFVAALDGTGVPHAYLTYEGEQHGFRMASTIESAMTAELSFYGQVLGFTPPGAVPLPLAT